MAGKKILVSLVSDQTIPNALFIKTMSEYNDYLFITTKLMQNRQKTQAICKASGIEFNFDNEISVLENSIEDVTRKIADNYDSNNNYVVNITGGNKLIFLAVFNFFNALNIPIYYKPIDEDNYIGINLEKKKIQITHKLSVEEYLHAHKVEFTFGNIDIRFEETKILFNEYKKLNYSITDLQSQYPVNSQNTVTGKWFEYYCFYKIKETLQLDDNQIAANVEITTFKTNRKNDREFDIVFVKNNQLYIIEAKVSIGESNFSKNLDKILFKLSAFNQTFGLRSHAYLFTLADIQNRTNEFIKDLDTKLKVLNIKSIFDRNVISDNQNFIDRLKIM